MKTPVVLILGLLAASAPHVTLAQASQPNISSPYMNAKDTELVTLENGAKVGRDTEAYWTLPEQSDRRASYDKDTAIKVADGVWTFGTASIVNSHAIQGPDGLIVYDTGDNVGEGKHFYDMLRSVTDAPIRPIIYSHGHYVNGAKAFVDEEAKRGNTEIKIVGHPETNASVARTGGVSAFHPEVSSILMARSIEQFNIYLPDKGPDARFKNTIIPGPGGFVPVNAPVTDGQTMQVAGLELVFYTEGIATDTANQVLVWIPSRKLVLNNVVWGWYPNIYSARGGRYRDPRGWMAAIERIRELNPEILLSTHSTSLHGANKIQQRLETYRDGLALVLDQTLKGILLGLGPDELRYYVRVPKYLEDAPILVQNYGEVAVMAPAIYAAIFGPYDRNAAHLNKLHPMDEAKRMVDAMGGPESMYDKAAKAHQAGDYLWACQLADYLVKGSDTEKNRQLKANCLREMGYRSLSTNSRSWYLSQARALEGKANILSTVPADPSPVDTNIADYVNYYRVRVDPERAVNTDKVLGLRFGDQTFGLHVRKGVVEFAPDLSKYRRNADVVVEMPTQVWTVVFNNLTDPDTLLDQGKIKVSQGTAAEAKAIFGLFDPIYNWQNDKALQDLAKQMERQ